MIMAKIKTAVKKVVKKAVSVVKKKKIVEKVEEPVVEVVPAKCSDCGGRGLLDQHTLCSHCEGHGTI